MACPPRALRELRPSRFQGPAIPSKEAEAGEAARLRAHLPAPLAPPPVAVRLPPLGRALAIAAQEAATEAQCGHPGAEAAPPTVAPPIEQPHRVPVAHGRVALAPLGPATGVVRLPVVAVGLDVVVPALRPRIPGRAAPARGAGRAPVDGPP